MRNKFLFGMLVTVLAFSVLVGCTEPAEDHPLVGGAWGNTGTTSPFNAAAAGPATIQFKADGVYEYLITNSDGAGLTGFKGKYTINTSENKKEITYTVTHLKLKATATLTAPVSTTGTAKDDWKEIPGDFYWSGDDKNAPDKIRDFLRDLARDGLANDAEKAAFDIAWNNTGADRPAILGGGVNFATITDLFNNVYLKYAKYTFAHVVTDGAAADTLNLTTTLGGAGGSFTRAK